MSETFLYVVDMSILASWIVLVLLPIRLLLKRAPKWIIVLLWGIVGIRLICPINIESEISLMPSTKAVNSQILIGADESDISVSTMNNTFDPINGNTANIVETNLHVNILQDAVIIFSKVWVVGIVGMLIYAGISYFSMKRKIGMAVLLRDNIYQGERIVSPFVLGVITPKIYLPFNINACNIEYVIAHEQAHVRRKDYWWKPLGFIVLTIHWFNPLMWLGYVLLCRDIEFACDEKVIKELNTQQKADYSQTLLNCSVNRHMIAVCPLAFGEVSVKNRVKSVLNYKKPSFWIIMVAILTSIAVAVCFLTNPKTPIDDELSVFLDCKIMEHHSSGTKGHFSAIDYEILTVDNTFGEISVYMWVLYHEYSCESDEIKLEMGAHIPTVITVKNTGTHGHYELIEYWEPRGGTYYAGDIKDKFPKHLHDEALDSQRYIDKQTAACYNAAKEYFSSLCKDDSTD